MDGTGKRNACEGAGGHARLAAPTTPQAPRAGCSRSGALLLADRRRPGGHRPADSRNLKASIGASCGLAFGQNGNLVFTDENSDLVEVEAATSGTFYGQQMIAGHVYTIGGNGQDGYSGNGGPAVDARLSTPAGVTVDQAGNVIFDDSDNDVLRIIAAGSGTFYGLTMTAGDIYTVAGGGHDYGRSGIPATKAGLGLNDNDGEYPGVQPWPLVSSDRAGNIVFAEGSAGARARIEVVAGRTGRFYGRQMKVGYIYVLAGGGRRAIGPGIPATQASFVYPSGIAVDRAGNVLVADPGQGRHQVYVIAVSTGRFYGRQMRAGDIYVLAGNGTEGSAGDGGPAAKAEFSGPDGVTVDSAGNVIVTDGQGAGYDSIYENGRIRVIAESDGSFYGMKMTAGDIYTISGDSGHTFFGDGGPATRALIALTSQRYGTATDTGISVSPAGGLVAFADETNNRIRVVPERSGLFFGQHMKALDIYTIAGDGKPGFAGDSGPGRRAMLRYPAGLTFDAAGNVVLTDTGNNRVRVVAARTGDFYGRQMTAGHIYTLAGTGRPGSSGDGGPASTAELHHPAGIAIDRDGNIVVADRGQVRVIAAHSGTYYGRPMKAGYIYGVARLRGTGVAVDHSGNLIVSCKDTVDVVAVTTGRFYGQHMITGHVYVIAGGGKPTGTGDGGPATAAYLTPAGVAVGRSGNVVIADTQYGANKQPLLRVVAVKSGVFYGVAMKAGDIYTIAGAGSGGLGDNGPALRARFSYVTGVAIFPQGKIVVLDANRVRVIYPAG
jgi:trimeric autotransporter adhesin